MATYENVTFGQLTSKKQEFVRETIARMWADGYSAEEISKKVRISTRSVATAMGNLTRKHLPVKKKSARFSPKSTRTASKSVR
jgi:DNA-binding NarL/FixJ family response regulator